KALVDISGCSIRRCGPDQRRNGIDELLQAPLPFTQRLDSFLVHVIVERDAKPPRNATFIVAHRSGRGASPHVDTVRAPKAKLNVEMIASLQTVPPYGGDLVIVVRMNQPLPRSVSFLQ